MIPDIDLAIFTDKPSLARRIAQEVVSMPELTGLRILYPIVWPVGVFLPPDRPHDPRDYPTIVPFEAPSPVFRDSLVGVPSDVNLTFWRNPFSFQAALEAGRLLSLTCLSSIYRLDWALREFTGSGLHHTQHHTLHSWSSKEIQQTIRGQCDAKEDVEQAINAGRVRHYFHVQFAANSLALLSPLTGIDECFVSKFQVQLLYAFRSLPPASATEWHFRMQNWKGAPLGSIRSFSSIFSGLADNGWIASNGTGVPSKWGLTASGMAFLDKLHPAGEDRSLPARLLQWSQQPLGLVRPEMDAYLLAWFSRQRAFSGLTPS